MSYRDEVIKDRPGRYMLIEHAFDIAARADARIAELEQSVTVRDTEIARLRDGLYAVYQYGSDTLTGPTVEPDDRKWQRDGVLEMTRRARRALDGLPAIEDRTGNGGGV